MPLLVLVRAGRAVLLSDVVTARIGRSRDAGLPLINGALERLRKDLVIS
jgi:hypothetical protein